MSWEQVRNLESLATLQMKIAEDALDDCIEYLREDRRKFEEALEKSRQIKGKAYGPGCIGYSIE